MPTSDNSLPAGAIELTGRDLFARIESAAHNAATSPFSRNQPTQAQRNASDYAKGEFVWHGLNARIENPRNTYREKSDKGGKVWRCRMAAHYGDFPGFTGADGDAVDAFFGPFPESGAVWVINQRRAGTNDLDEQKAMCGFVSEAQARSAYLDSYDRDWKGLMSIVRATVSQFKWWLQHGDKSRPFSASQLPFEGNNIMDKVLWNKDAEPITRPLHTIMYELRQADAKAGLLLDAVTMDEMMTDPDLESAQVYDALVVEVNRMTVKMDMLKRVMESAGVAVKPTEVTISDPVRARGAAQVMVLFQMSDGQTVSVWFHNPDTTPAKLTPMDELISWKWMLNRKDCTIVVAPERGTDLNVREVARRIMRLVDRNTEAFTKANAKATERAAEAKALDAEITGLEGELKDLTRQIEVAQINKEDADRATGAKIGALTAELDKLRAQAESEKARIELGGTTEVLQNVLNKADDLADQIRALKGEAATGRTSWDAWAAMNPAKKKFNPLDPDGYAKVLADKELQVEHQDELDAYFQGRIIDVRNALRDLGWEGDKFQALSKNGAVLSMNLTKVGAGNVVGVQYLVTGNVAQGGSDPTQDMPEFTASEIAQDVDTKVKKAPEGQEDAALAVEYLPLAEASVERLQFAYAGLGGLHGGESAYFVANPKRPDDIASGVGYWSEKVASVRAKPTELLYSLSDVGAEIDRRAGGQGGAKPDGAAAEAPEKADLRQRLEQLSPGQLKQFAARFVFFVDNKTGEQLIASMVSGENYSVSQVLASLMAATDVGDSLLEKRDRVSDWPKSKLGWTIVDDGSHRKKAPGYASEQSAKIAISKNPEWKAAGATIAPFMYWDGSVGGKSSERYAVVIRVGAEEGSTAPEQTPAQLVDAAYKFADATNAFKEWVADSLDETDYSPFATAKAMDQAAIAGGATISWDVVGTTLDSARQDEESDEDEDFDENEEWEAMPEADEEVEAE